MSVAVQKRIDVKKATLKENTLSGVPNVMGILDRGRDVIFPGAFTRKGALSRFKEHGFIAVGHDYGKLPVAMPLSIEEDGSDLVSTCEFHSTPDAQAARTVAKERLAKKLSVPLSIGFDMEPEDYDWYPNGKSLLAAAKSLGCDMSLFDQKTIAADTGMMRGISAVSDLWEYSLVPIGMNQQSFADDVKSGAAEGGVPELLAVFTADLKRATGARDLPLAPRETKWTASEAVGRVREFCGATDGPNKRYARAFLVVDGDAANFTSYKMPFADVTDGELHAVPNAIFAAAAVIDGSRGGVDISEADKESVKNILRHYYERMAKEFDDDTIKPPFDAKSEDDGKGKKPGSVKSLYRPWWMEGDDDTTAADATIASLNVLYNELCGDIYDVLYDGDMGIEDKVAALEPEFEGYRKNAIAVIRALLTVLADEDDADGEMSGKALARLALWAKVAPGQLRIGDCVAWGAGGESGEESVGESYRGQIERIERSGNAITLPGHSEPLSLIGTEAEPVAIIRIYTEGSDTTDGTAIADVSGFLATDRCEAHPLAALSKTAPLRKAASYATDTTPRRLEKALHRYANLSRREAKIVASHGFQALQREVAAAVEAQRAEEEAKRREAEAPVRHLLLREKELRARAALVETV